ncbi:MAG: hypothetical protein IPK78_10765 [Rhodospirillales bacterium]|nr:hypothetical protein [Rhodospirillales bacterium]
MLSIGFESISRETLRSVHKYQNTPESYRALGAKVVLVEKIQNFGILVFGLFMFGFDQEDASVLEETAKFNIYAGYDVCAYSVLTPFPGTVSWYEMLRDKRMVYYDWDKYGQGYIVYRPKNISPEQLRAGHMTAYKEFYSLLSIIMRFLISGSRSSFY